MRLTVYCNDQKLSKNININVNSKIQLDDILHKPTALSPLELEGIIAASKQLLPDFLSKINEKVEHYPCCHRLKFVKFGIRLDVQRYVCKDCRRHFTCLTNTPFERLHHEKVQDDYIKEILNGSSLEKSAAVCRINIKAAFKWRHRFLGTIKNIIIDKIACIIEFDENKILKLYQSFYNSLKKNGKLKSNMQFTDVRLFQYKMVLIIPL